MRRSPREDESKITRVSRTRRSFRDNKNEQVSRTNASRREPDDVSQRSQNTENRTETRNEKVTKDIRPDLERIFERFDVIEHEMDETRKEFEAAFLSLSQRQFDFYEKTLKEIKKSKKTLTDKQMSALKKEHAEIIDSVENLSDSIRE